VLPDTSDPRMDEIAAQMQDLYEKRDVRSHLRGGA
jgi:hypothetical protein